MDLKNLGSLQNSHSFWPPFIIHVPYVLVVLLVLYVPLVLFVLYVLFVLLASCYALAL